MTSTADHERQIHAAQWLTVAELAARWNVSESTVRKIPRDALPYLTLGASGVRRFDPADVQTFEQTAKHAAA